MSNLGGKEQKESLNLFSLFVLFVPNLVLYLDQITFFAETNNREYFFFQLSEEKREDFASKPTARPFHNSGALKSDAQAS